MPANCMCRRAFRVKWYQTPCLLSRHGLQNKSSGMQRVRRSLPRTELSVSVDDCIAAASRKKRVAKKVPKGTSEYQAAWIVETDSEQVGSYRRLWTVCNKRLRINLWSVLL